MKCNALNQHRRRKYEEEWEAKNKEVSYMSEMDGKITA